MITPEPTQPLTDEDFARLRRSAETALAACTGSTLWRTVVEGTLVLLDEVDRLRAELAEARRVADHNTAQFLKAMDAINGEYADVANDRDDLKRQIDWLAEWLTEHTDEPKGSYGAVEAAINAMAGFQRHIDRSAEVWAQNRQDLEQLRAENTAMAEQVAKGRAVLTDRIAKWKAQQEVWQNMPTSALDRADLLRVEFEQARQGEVEDLLERFDAATGPALDQSGEGQPNA